MANESKQWIRPWNMEKFDDLFNRDERYFAVLLKGMLAWFNNNIVMYNKPINHFIFTTGSSYMYIESNGYEFKWNETSGEDWMYMQLPRCVVEPGSLRVPTEELTSPFVRGNYERRDGNSIKGFNAQVRRLPIEMDFTFRYYFSNFNETIVFLQEALDKLLFQRYFNISYLGEIIKCSIEMPQDFNIQINPIDMTSTDPKQRTIELAIKLNSNYPLVDDRTEIGTDRVISTFVTNIPFNKWTQLHPLSITDDDGNTFEVYYNDNNVLVRKDRETEVEVDSTLLVDEFGEQMTEKKLNELFNYNAIGMGSTIVTNDVTNPIDRI